jgi:hypothetical protein
MSAHHAWNIMTDRCNIHEKYQQGLDSQINTNNKTDKLMLLTAVFAVKKYCLCYISWEKYKDKYCVGKYYDLRHK